MWDEFYKDIKDEGEFNTREDYEMWVRAWVEDTINEAGRIERFALGLDNDEADKELDVKIGGEDE